MAFREVRIYFMKSRRDAVKRLNLDLGNPFTFYMDAIMRGHFKDYSGPDVRGLNIVNLFLYEPRLFAAHRIPVFPGWHSEMNMYCRKIAFQFTKLSRGSRSQRLGRLIDIFLHEAQRSELPQMRRLVDHMREAKGKVSLDTAIQRGDEYFEALRRRVDKRRKEAQQGAAPNP